MSSRDTSAGCDVRTRRLLGDGDYGVLVYKLNGEVIDVPGDNLKEIST